MGRRRKNKSTRILGKEIAFLSGFCIGDGQSWQKAQDVSAVLERRCSCVNLVLIFAPPFPLPSAASCSGLQKPLTQTHISWRVLLSCLPCAPECSVHSVRAGITFRLGGVVGAAVFFSQSRHTGISLPSAFLHQCLQTICLQKRTLHIFLLP